MTTQKLISDARRRARTESRDTGRSYQTILDEIAHQAGRASWSAFKLDPAPALPSNDDDKGSPVPTFDPDDRQWNEWVVGTEQTGRVPIVLGVALVLAALLAPNYVRMDAPYATEIFICVLLTGLGLMAASLWRTGCRIILLGALSWSAPRPMGARRAVRLIAGMTARVAMFFFVTVSFTEFGPLLMTGAKASTIQVYESDVRSHRTIRMEGPRRDTPVASYALQGDHARLTIVIADVRLQPRPMRTLFMGDRMGGRSMSEAMKDNPVVRFAGTVDCTTGRFKVERVEVAASYDAHAALTKPVRMDRGRGAAIDRADVGLICHENGSTL